MNRRAFLSTVSTTALLAALPLPLVMGRAAKAATLEVMTLPSYRIFYDFGRLDREIWTAFSIPTEALTAGRVA